MIQKSNFEAIKGGDHETASMFLSAASVDRFLARSQYHEKNCVHFLFLSQILLQICAGSMYFFIKEYLLDFIANFWSTANKIEDTLIN